MKTIAMIVLTFFLGKSCTNCTQNDLTDTTIQYTANTRGFYQKIIIKNQKAAVYKDRNNEEVSEEIAISDSDWKELITYFEKVNLEELSDYKDPTQQRFYDGAAIADLKIIYQKKEYKTRSFDHGYPPKEIEKLVNKIVSFGKKE